MRIQPGMINASVNKDNKDKNLNELLMSSGDVRLCQVVTVTGVTVQTDCERPTPRCSTPLWLGCLALIWRLLHAQVHY